jgi:hypothetical protein
MKIITLPDWIWIGTFEWLTLYKLVLIKKGVIDRALTISHEAIHVEQIERLGFFKWLYIYITELYKNGYRGNSLEMEAYAREHENVNKYKGL